jgi:hypothetical protein
MREITTTSLIGCAQSEVAADGIPICQHTKIFAKIAKMQDSGIDLDTLPVLSDEDISLMDGDFYEIRSKPLEER